MWLTRVQGGRYYLTHLKPVIHRVYGTRRMDVYARYGEPTEVKHLCEPGVLRQFGSLGELLVPRKVRLMAEFVEE